MRFWRRKRLMRIEGRCSCGPFIPGTYEVTQEPFETQWQCRHCGWTFTVKLP
jgi:hypothetical protein